MIGGTSSSERVRPGLTLEHAVDVTQRFLAPGLIALVIGVARLIHGLGDRLRLLAGEIACLLFDPGVGWRCMVAKVDSAAGCPCAAAESKSLATSRSV